MATMPAAQMTPPPGGAAPAASQPEAGVEEGATGGYEICIQVGGDGQITVGVESGEYENAEEQGAQAAGMEKPAMKPVADFQEAIKTAMDIYKAGGQMASSEGEAEGFGASFSA